MNDKSPVYNSRIILFFLEYVADRYPDLDIGTVLDYAGLTEYEIKDPACWINQEQADRFHEALVEKTANPNIAREAGRYAGSSKASGAVKHYIMGLLNPGSVYVLMSRFYACLSRGADVKAVKKGSGKVEISTTPAPGVNEKLYQCENRKGIFESVAKIFTGNFAHIEHPLCFHKGDGFCKYIITWGKVKAIKWKLARNAAFFCSLLAVCFFFLLPLKTSAIIFLAFINLTLFCASCSYYCENKELSKTVQAQGDVAGALLEEMTIRHNNAILAQQIGQAVSCITDVNRVVSDVVSLMEKYLDFNRGLIMLADKKKEHLVYSAGFGYSMSQGALLKKTEFNLTRPDSRGAFVLAFKEQRSFLLNDVLKEGSGFSQRSIALAKKMSVKSMICVPLIYEKESLGIMAVDNVKSKRPLTQSDINHLTGIASQTAISIVNAMAFKQIHDSEQKYRDLVENARCIILRMDTQGVVSFFNEFAQTFFGFAENEIIGKKLQSAIITDNESARDDFAELLRTAGNDPECNLPFEQKCMLKNGETAWISWTFRPVFDERGKLKEFLCIGIDITELKKGAAEKKLLEARLQRAKKMEAIGTLAGGVAHDLNNILSGIVSYPDLLLMDIPPDSPLERPIRTIKKSGERAAAIVQDLLTLARRGVVNRAVTNLGEIINDYLKSPEHKAWQLNFPHVKVVTNLDKRAMNILGSPVHLEKTIMNLFYNAAEAMPEGGVVSILLQNRYIDRPVSGYDDVNEGDYVVLTVSDTGTGIDPEEIERIFEPFYTKKTMGKSGTGLGMAVIWGTVKDHDGYIDIKSEKGKGTALTLYFPVTRKEIDETGETVPRELYLGRGESVLVVDDVPEQREIAAGILNKLGYSVATAASGEEAVEYLRSAGADIIILDMIMEPGMDGLDTYRNILNLYPGQKAIITSGFSETGRVKQALDLGVGAYIKKPYSLENLGRALREELDGET